MYSYLRGKPVIKYPCRWVYKLFGTDQGMMREAVERAIPGIEYTLTPSHSSRHKKYHCMNLEVLVADEQERTGIFQALSNQRDFVLIL